MTHRSMRQHIILIVPSRHVPYSRKRKQRVVLCTSAVATGACFSVVHTSAEKGKEQQSGSGRTWLLCQIFRERPMLLATAIRPRSHSWMPCTSDVTLKKSAICIARTAHLSCSAQGHVPLQKEG
jgi:hypothetical protein